MRSINSTRRFSAHAPTAVLAPLSKAVDLAVATQLAYPYGLYDQWVEAERHGDSVRAAEVRAEMDAFIAAEQARSAAATARFDAWIAALPSAQRGAVCDHLDRVLWG